VCVCVCVCVFLLLEPRALAPLEFIPTLPIFPTLWTTNTPHLNADIATAGKDSDFQPVKDEVSRLFQECNILCVKANLVGL